MTLVSYTATERIEPRPEGAGQGAVALAPGVHELDLI